MIFEEDIMEMVGSLYFLCIVFIVIIICNNNWKNYICYSCVLILFYIKKLYVMVIVYLYFLFVKIFLKCKKFFNILFNVGLSKEKEKRLIKFWFFRENFLFFRLYLF